MLIYTRIGRPAEAHGVASPAAYVARQAHALAEFNRLYPTRPAAVPTRCNAPLAGPLVSGGRWVVVCHCHNGPSYDPDLQLALCFECGAVYEQLAPPADWTRAEALLMARPAMAMRHWLPGETVDDLARENAANGHSVVG